MFKKKEEPKIEYIKFFDNWVSNNTKELFLKAGVIHEEI